LNVAEQKRVLVCANPDLNYIDGSSIWSQTIALAVAATGKAQVDFLARSTPEREELFGPLHQDSQLQVIDGTRPDYWKGKSFQRLTPPMMADLALQLDNDRPYDAIIVRGLEIAEKLLDHPGVLARCWVYLTDIPQTLEDYSVRQHRRMHRIADGSQRILCQTEGFRSLWHTLAPKVEHERFHLYEPVIPDLPQSLPPIHERPCRAVYAGKFKTDWMTLEMAENWPQVRAQVPGGELVMIGDKIHEDPHETGFEQRMRHALESTAGLSWMGAQPRNEVQRQLQQARVGLSWRAESMNDTVEYSTKILEYGGAGCAAIVNRNPLHEQLLGSDYPLFANSPGEFTQQLTRALSEPETAQKAANRLTELAGRHTFSSRVDELRQWLAETPRAPRPARKTRVVVAGHDLKFFTPLQKKLEATGQFEFLIDQWQGHDKHDEDKSLELLEKADVIFCEWCLGNLKWYSHQKNPHQRLVARFHAQEARVCYMAEACWGAIDHIIFVSEHTRRYALEIFKGFRSGKTSVIPNYIDDTKFTSKKKTDEARFTLGMVGIAPKSKRLDRALDLLNLLLEEDDRYCLRLKGKHPLNYEWLLNRQEERSYYREVFERINKSPGLRYKVIFDPPGDDVNDWFRMVGYILSPSDYESFHIAVGEGILTETKPVVWDWVGAVNIWGANNVVSDLFEAKKMVLQDGDRTLIGGPDTSENVIEGVKIILGA
jgi:glycosyltransferase involved in cell wall biosynthesis